MINNEKYFPMYQDLAVRVSQESYAKRKQVGCVILSKSGMISVGMNGTASGMPNICEHEDGTTHDFVIHAEQNALHKMAREGVATSGSIVFVTLSPCVACAKSLIGVGVSAVYYRDHHRESAIQHLRDMDVVVKQWSE